MSLGCHGHWKKKKKKKSNRNGMDFFFIYLHYQFQISTGSGFIQLLYVSIMKELSHWMYLPSVCRWDDVTESHQSELHFGVQSSNFFQFEQMLDGWMDGWNRPQSWPCVNRCVHTGPNGNNKRLDKSNVNAVGAWIHRRVGVCAIQERPTSTWTPCDATQRR